MSDNRNTVPMWLGGILLALVLILISSRGGGVNNAALRQRFAPQPTDPSAPTPAPFQLPQVHLPDLPASVRQTFTRLRDQFASGQAVPALTPVASGPRARVEIGEVRRDGDHVQVRGTVTNIGKAPLSVPPGAFTFRDSAGVTYATTGSGSATLQPGQATTLDLGLPLPADRGLTLVVLLPPDPPLLQVLVVETKG
jgi:hypothetical protein